MSVVVTRRAPRVRALALALSCAAATGIAGQPPAPVPGQPTLRLAAYDLRVERSPTVNGRAVAARTSGDIEMAVERAAPAFNTLEYVRTLTVGGPDGVADVYTGIRVTQ